MAAHIDYFFTPISGYAYLGHAALAAMAARHGCAVAPRPVDLAAVFEAVGVVPPPRQHPARLRYRQADMQRWARHRALPLVVKPRFWPADAMLSSLCIVAARLRGEDAMGLAGAFLTAIWAEERNIADRDTVAGILDRCGLDAPGILDFAAGDACRARFNDNTREAIERGALGSPTMFVGDTMIFGQDRLPFVEQALAGASSSPPPAKETRHEA